MELQQSNSLVMYVVNVVSVVSLGKSSQSIHIHFITLHYQFATIISIIEHECIFTHLNGSQFRQV